VTRHGSSPNQQFNLGQTSYQAGGSPPNEEWLGGEMPEFTYSNDMVYEGEQPLAQLERIAARLVNGQSVEQSPSTVPLLGYLVPGAESCALFYSDPAKHQLRPTAVANLSGEFIYALANEDGEHLLNAAKQAEPYLLINLPGNKQFEALGRLSHREGIRTLWLIPWREADGSIFGAFLFASKEAFSPSREAIVSVTLLTSWMAAMLRQASDRQYSDRFTAGSDHDKNYKTRIEDDHRIVAMDRLIRDLNGSRQDRTINKNKNQLSYFFTGGTDTSATVSPRVYEDKHGLPVTYDAATHEQRKQTRTDAISVLWHELLSPLTIIKGYTSTLLQLHSAINEEQKEQYIQGIESASNRMIRLLENLRDITRLEETDNLTSQRVSMPDLLRSIISEMQSQTTNHIIKLRPSARLPLVNADPEKIEQVINNLLFNAIKYSPQRGDIEAEIQMVQSEQELRKMFGDTPRVSLPCLIVSVADTGIGIPEAELNHIFERFYRVNNKLTRATPGAGLGLYICRVIVEAHGGHIWAKNRLQGGSIFSFSLPLDQSILKRS
jgi:nitrogen-specific signal transduction histidine kinase